MVYKGIEGETREYNGKEYNYKGISDLTVTENSDGTVYYDFTMKDGVKFSDGEPLTVDDVIFSMYVFADPTYDGNASFFSLPIQGMNEYRSGVDTLFNLLVAAGEENTDFSKWTEEQQKSFWTEYKTAVDAFVKEDPQVHCCKEHRHRFQRIRKEKIRSIGKPGLRKKSRKKH